MSRYSFFTFLSVLLAGVCSEKNPYCDLHCYGAPMHTVCERSAENCGPDPGCGPDFREVPFTDEQRQQILDQHNELRNKVALGKQDGQPPASNMRELTWNKELEYIAQCWMNACKGDPMKHDKCRRTAEYKNVGQNLAATYSNADNFNIKPVLTQLTQVWYDEVKDFDPKLVPSYQWDYPTGHYSQFVWANTSEIGCAATVYSSQKSGRKMFVFLYGCNYGPAGNWDNRPVYEEGKPTLRSGSKFEGLI
ncbi:unnamed protein product [Phaedon cochleariae]|uniref:SCP domain-containing protein n=1 Tax=Phaedon cochleariae TaxID=80249 RepID=A0A9N9SCY7_PHACE|nr:unnamed protein product [Phaedon cochleariae]